MKLEDHKTVMLNEECNAILLNKFPSKLKDPGSFSIPCIIGNLKFDNILCDFGASINYSLSLFLGHWIWDNRSRLLSHSNWQIDR